MNQAIAVAIILLLSCQSALPADSRIRFCPKIKKALLECPTDAIKQSFLAQEEMLCEAYRNGKYTEAELDRQRALLMTSLGCRVAEGQADREAGH